jgi:hypothetical protein
LVQMMRYMLNGESAFPQLVEGRFPRFRSDFG